MTINPQYQNEYNNALQHLADMTQHFNDYLHNLEHNEQRILDYIDADEQHMIQQYQDCLQRYHQASQHYFIKN
jgi:hypothetical protein